MAKYEIISATKRYGKRTPGLSILLRNGKEVMLDKTPEVRDLYNSIMRDNAIKSIGDVYVVVTIVNDGERDLFSDVVLITTDEKYAQKVANLLTQKKFVRGINRRLLSDFESAAVFSRPLNSLKCWRLTP
jgi:hypothetical protein